MSAIVTLCDLLAGTRSPARVAPRHWSAVISVARAEALVGTLAFAMEGAELPENVAVLFAAVRTSAAVARDQALWEAEMARRALAPLGIPFILLKGTAYAAADLRCSRGRQIGDLDILVADADLARAEGALIAAGWEWVKEDAYDDTYYRQHMHELPPLIHKRRDRMIDVHHNILPRTHRSSPDATAILARSRPLANGFVVAGPADMACHCAAHLLADGDLQGGLRNLWDFHCLVEDFGGAEPGYWDDLAQCAAQHGIDGPVRRAARLANQLFRTHIPPGWAGNNGRDKYFQYHLLARDNWGREKSRGLRFAFYVRSHWLRMPPVMLARHLWVKWRKGR